MTPLIKWSGVCIDCSNNDFEAMLGFYSRLLGWEVDRGCARPSECTHDGDHWASMRDPGAPPISEKWHGEAVALLFQGERWYEPPVWPEQPGAKDKMLHLEILVENVEEAVTYTVASGGRVAPSQPPDRDQDRLRIMLDPAGHPFCLYSG